MSSAPYSDRTPDSDSGQPVTVGDAATTARILAENAAATAQTLADALSEVLATVSGKLADLQAYGQQDRAKIVDLKTYNKRYNHVVIGLAISLALDVSLSIITILLGLGLLSQSGIQQASLIASCQASNVTRVQDKAAWNLVLGISATITVTADPAVLHERSKLVAELRKSVTSKDAPVDCAKRFGG